MRIAIGGDFCPTGSVGDACRQGDAVAVFGDVLSEFHRADLAVVNLECPLTDRPSPIQKSGPVLGAPSGHSRVFASAGIDMIGLANNHAMDHGGRGLADTIKACEGAGAACFGAGSNLAAAGAMRVRDVGGFRVAVLGMCEREFGIASFDRPGVNPLDPIAFTRAVRARRDDWDYLIVLIHGGNEFYPYPRPSLRDTCRFLVEQGADAVICQHSHCVGCYEHYEGAHIVYGQGNLLFDHVGGAASWYTGLLVALEIQGSRDARVQFIPFTQSRPRHGVWRMGDNEADAFLRDFHERSERIKDSAFVNDRWMDFCRENRSYYLGLLGAPNRWFRGFDRITGYTRLIYGSAQLRSSHLNLIRCESHREALITILSEGLL